MCLPSRHQGWKRDADKVVAWRRELGKSSLDHSHVSEVTGREGEKMEIKYTGKFSQTLRSYPDIRYCFICKWGP